MVAAFVELSPTVCVTAVVPAASVNAVPLTKAVVAMSVELFPVVCVVPVAALPIDPVTVVAVVALPPIFRPDAVPVNPVPGPENCVEAVIVVPVIAAAVVPPIAGGDAKYVEKPEPDIVDDADSVVKDAGLGTFAPMTVLSK